MTRFFLEGGVFMWPLSILAIVVGVLVVRGAWAVFGRVECRDDLRQRLHAILFWGVIAALLGVVGQVNGVYNAASAVRHAAEISPQVVAAGIAESCTTTLTGFAILLVAAVAWFVLWNRAAALAQRPTG